MIRWLVTGALCVPMGLILYLLNVERVRRVYEYWLPDASLPFDEFQAALTAHKDALFWQGVGWAILGTAAIAAAGIAASALHRRIASGGAAASHWMAVAYAVPAFLAIVCWLVTHLRA